MLGSAIVLKSILKPDSLETYQGFQMYKIHGKLVKPQSVRIPCIYSCNSENEIYLKLPVPLT